MTKTPQDPSRTQQCLGVPEKRVSFPDKETDENGAYLFGFIDTMHVTKLHCFTL
jgi:hypothetical protein